MPTINVTEPDPRHVANEALPILRRLKRRDAEYEEERERERRLPTNRRSYDWQSYCHHGTYVGDPYGGDYMCGRCEDGISVYDEAVAEAHVIVQLRLTALACLFTLDNLGVFGHLSGDPDELREALDIRITQRLYN